MTKRLALLAGLLALTPFSGAKSADPGYAVTNLVANKPQYSPQIIDPLMIDAWGIAIRPPGAGGHIWISNTHSGTSSEFIGDVGGKTLHQDNLKVVTLDTPAFADRGYAYVTGQAYNAASDIPGQPVEFPISGPASDLTKTPAVPLAGGFAGAAKFAFVTMDGCVNAWSSKTALSMDDAPILVDYSKCAEELPFRVNCVFTGTAFSSNAHDSAAFTSLGGNHLYVADFRNNAVMVFDARWKDVTKTWKFRTPETVKDLHPFNIVDLGGRLFVTYARFDEASDEGQEQVVGAGLGHLVEYAEDGALVRDYKDAGTLNAPWGVALAPATFGIFAGDLLVGNFGDGTIAAFDTKTGAFKGYLRDADTKIISIDGLWGLAFGNGVSLGSAESLYFTAGPNAEADGVFGRVDSRAPASAPAAKR